MKQGTREKALGNYGQGSRGLQQTGQRSESREQHTRHRLAGRAPLRRRAKERLVWMHGLKLKEREEIAGLTRSRAKAMDTSTIYPTLLFGSCEMRCLLFVTLVSKFNYMYLHS
jgi:hypothetical protein